MPGHKFDPANLKRLNSAKRRAVLPPELVIKNIGVEMGETWTDVGCGTGYFSLPLARACHQVIATDIRTEMLNELMKNVELEASPLNIQARQSEENTLPVSNEAVDGALLALVAHELDEPVKFFQELSRILRPGGRLIVIEWVKAPTEMGPPLEHRLEVDTVDGWAGKANLVKGQSWLWSNVFIGLEYVKGIDTTGSEG